MSISTDQEFNRASIAALDFEKAIEFATAAQRYPANVVEYEALLFVALVCYVRPFSGNEKSAASSATSRLDKEIVKVLPKPERELHDKCCFLRGTHGLRPLVGGATRNLTTWLPVSVSRVGPPAGSRARLG